MQFGPRDERLDRRLDENPAVRMNGGMKEGNGMTGMNGEMKNGRGPVENRGMVRSNWIEVSSGNYILNIIALP